MKKLEIKLNEKGENDPKKGPLEIDTFLETPIDVFIDSSLVSDCKDVVDA